MYYKMCCWFLISPEEVVVAHDRIASYSIMFYSPHFQFLLNPHSVKLYPHFTELLHWSGLEPRTQCTWQNTNAGP